MSAWIERLQSCQRKRGYDSKSQAQADQSGTVPLVAYRCVVCGKFHNGKPNRRQRFRAASVKQGVQ